jgi:hypothetical protein
MSYESFHQWVLSIHLKHTLSTLSGGQRLKDKNPDRCLHQPRFVSDMNLQLSDHNSQSIHFGQIGLWKSGSEILNINLGRMGRMYLVGPYLWGSFCLRRLELQRMSVSNETRPPENLQVTHLRLGRQYDSLSYSIWPISPCFQKKVRRGLERTSVTS